MHAEEPNTVPLDGPIALDLRKATRRVLAAGLIQWGGPCSPSDRLAVDLGFDGWRNLMTESAALARAIDAGSPLTASEWRRARASFAAVLRHPRGATTDWDTVTGYSVAEGEEALSQLERAVREVWTGND